jgi:uncharacterized protein YkwD
MDPITVTHVVQDRTQNLQRIADQVRQERSLRSTPPVEADAALARLAEARRAPAPAPGPTEGRGCAPAEPAV